MIVITSFECVERMVIQTKDCNAASVRLVNALNQALNTYSIAYASEGGAKSVVKL